MVGQPGSHRRRFLLKRRVRATPVIVAKIKRQRRFVVLPFLAERVRQTSQAAKRHANREIAPPDMACASPIRVWRSAASGNLGVDDFAG